MKLNDLKQERMIKAHDTIIADRIVSEMLELDREKNTCEEAQSMSEDGKA